MAADTKDGWFSDESATFGDRLAAAREAAGMSQKDLAKRVGVKLSTLTRWEDDQAEPRANRLSMLSGLLGVSLRWLLTGQGEGLSGPDAEEIPQDGLEILAELRLLRTESERLCERMGVLEKRLKRHLQGGA
ncbi:helix-turn-helix domain-containing protein [Histidinibacterium aquaticum]|uniref:Helix-turn-helix transcriptional regulator n=1 Tax=Histidinibacterium aquaticum TaxID=2613962 RepID=A0A5J5GRF3_9RHOB|nr:helix-turn-helix transcriptional regulator [Histidinibacterium aquaticum]KAA9010685.1 helix-turn-helix transcriptional regulator [Histidinibacterium aquaticum]